VAVDAPSESSFSVAHINDPHRGVVRKVVEGAFIDLDDHPELAVNELLVSEVAGAFHSDTALRIRPLLSPVEGA
jgi:hypothetical protein